VEAAQAKRKGSAKIEVHDRITKLEAAIADVCNGRR
jgi:hypothetical protein